MKTKQLSRPTALLLAFCLIFGALAPPAYAEAGVREYVKIYAVDNYSFAIDKDGDLWGWGANFVGQLGDGSTDMRLYATRIKSGVVSVSSGGNHTLAIDNSGQLWAWGYNGHGAFGDGTTVDSTTPKPVPGMDRVVSIAAGGNYSLAVRDDGSLWAWGNNRSGQLGDGTASNQLSPVQIMEKIKYVSTASDHSFAIDEDGALWSWGSNHHGKVGDGTDAFRSMPIKILDNVVSVSGGYDFSMAVTGDGALWAWGQTYSWALGAKENYRTPERIIGEGVSSVACGFQYAMYIDTEETLWAFGNNGSGQLGNHGTSNSWTAVPVLEDVADIACGSVHSLAVRTDGSLWGWGSDTYGQLGDGAGTNYVLPMKSLMDMDWSKITKLAAGDNHGMALMQDGSLWIWGENVQGQLGDGTVKDRPKPEKILDNVVDMDGGSSHTLAVQADGSLWAWGYNTYGQVGNDATINSRTPVKVLDGVVKVACGNTHSLAIKADGSLWAWGNNGSGQLGDGATANSRVPKKIMDGVAEAAGGYLHTVAVKTDGSLWTWGYNLSGQLGNGTTANSSHPLQIIAGGVAGAAAAANRTQALMEDGSLLVWGDNRYGQVGDGTGTQRQTPVAVWDGVEYVTSGGLRTLAIRGGDLYVWGAGPVGDGQVNDAIRGITTNVLPNVAYVATGYHNTYVLDKNGILWAWGNNLRGAMGYNEASPRELMPTGSIFPPGEPRIISSINLAGLAEPVTGAEPAVAGSLITSDRGYAVESVSWYPEPTGGVFASNESYVADVTLAAKSTYTFVGEVSPSVNAGDVVDPATVYGAAGGNKLAFQVTFAKTEDPPAEPLAPPTSDQPEGEFSGSLAIQLSADPGAAIYYTTNGGDPGGGAGLQYKGEITINDTATIRAVARKAGMADSGIASFTYVSTSEGVGGGAHDDVYKLLIDGAEVLLDVDPFLSNGQFLAHFRGIAMWMGCSAEWDEPAQRITVSDSSYTFVMTVGSRLYTLNDAPADAGAAVQVEGGRACVPIQALVESFGYSYEVDDVNRRILANSGGTAPVIVRIMFDANGGGGIMDDAAVFQGGVYPIAANAFSRSGYTFSGRNTTADGKGTAYGAGATISGVAADMTLYAQWKAATGGSPGGAPGGGGGSSGPATVTGNGSVSLMYALADGVATLFLLDDEVNEIIETASGSKAAVFDLSKVPNGVGVTFPKAPLSKLAGEGLSLELRLAQGTLLLDNAALKSGLAQANGSSLSFSIGAAGYDSLTAAQREAIRPEDKLYQISALSGNQILRVFEGALTIRLPYEGPLPVTVFYISAGGAREKMDSSYNPATKTVSFNTNHLSLFTLGGDMPAAGMQVNLTIGALDYSVNGAMRTMDAAPEIVNERTMVPLRFVAEALGAEVDWEDESRTAVVELDGASLRVTIGETAPGMDTPAMILHERTMVPLRYVGEALGCEVEWSPDTRSISIYKGETRG